MKDASRFNASQPSKTLTLFPCFHLTNFNKYWSFSLRDRSLFIAAVEDSGLNKVKISRSSLWMLLHWSDPPPNNRFDDFHPPPPRHQHVFIFQTNLSGPPLSPSKVFSDPPFWVLSYDWSPLFFSPKSSDPPKITLPPLSAINNDRSLNKCHWTFNWCMYHEHLLRLLNWDVAIELWSAKEETCIPSQLILDLSSTKS